MRLLLLGGTGQVGQEFRALDFAKNIEVFAPRRSGLDLCDAQAIANMVAAQPWNAVINVSGYTDVDRAEKELAKAFAINEVAPSRLAIETERHGIPFIHVSTDYVFDGRKGTPYLERDEVGPLNVYGRSKLAGEYAVSKCNQRHIILRTSWVYSQYRKNFVKTILRLATERNRLTIVDDQRGCPTAARDVARACWDIALRCASDPEQVPYGVYHFSGGGDSSWYEFASMIVQMASDTMVRIPEVVPIKTSDYPTPAIRPIDTRLNCEAITRAFGIKLRPWQDGLKETINQLIGGDGTL